MKNPYVRKPKCGRVKMRMAKLLAKHGYSVVAEALSDAQGFWRSSGVDHIRWEAQATTTDGTVVQLTSYSPMTLCLRWGISCGAWGSGGERRIIQVESPEPPPIRIAR